MLMTHMLERVLMFMTHMLESIDGDDSHVRESSDVHDSPVRESSDCHNSNNLLVDISYMCFGVRHFDQPLFSISTHKPKVVLEGALGSHV